MGIQPNFDTAQFEELLVDAGVDQAVARAHRSALAQALSQTVGALVTKEDQTLMESRLETAIASQTATPALQGLYQVTFGADIRDVGGTPMDGDGDGIPCASLCRR